MTIKKIILCANSAAALANFRINIIQFLIKNGYNVVIVAPTDIEVNIFKELGVKVVDWKLDSRGQTIIHEFISLIRLCYILFLENPDLSIFYGIKPIVYGNLINKFCRRKSLNVVTGLGYVFIEKRKLNIFIQKMLRFSFGKRSHTWCLNNDDMDLLVTKGLINKNQVSILHGEGVNTKYYKGIKSQNSDIFTFLMVSRVLKDKGVKEFALAAKSIKKSGIKARFVLVGSYLLEEENAVEPTLMNNWISSGLIEHKGHVQDVRPYIQACDCIVLPSYREGLPRALLEAFSMEKLAIAADVPGCRELVKEGETGFLCYPKNVESLVGALKKFIAMDDTTKRRLEKQARELVVENYSIESVCEQYLKFLNPKGVSDV